MPHWCILTLLFFFILFFSRTSHVWMFHLTPGSRHEERELCVKAESTVLVIRKVLLLEDIANAANCMDQAWFTPCLELGAQVADVNFHDI